MDQDDDRIELSAYFRQLLFLKKLLNVGNSLKNYLNECMLSLLYETCFGKAILNCQFS